MKVQPKGSYDDHATETICGHGRVGVWALGVAFRLRYRYRIVYRPLGVSVRYDSDNSIVVVVGIGVFWGLSCRNGICFGILTLAPIAMGRCVGNAWWISRTVHVKRTSDLEFSAFENAYEYVENGRLRGNIISRSDLP